MSSQRSIQFQRPGLIRQGISWAPLPLLKLLAQAIVRFRRQRQRTSLGQLDDRMLRDMGISRLEAERESRKPFWRD